MFRKKIGIDLGSKNLRVYIPGKGIVIDHPSLVCYSKSQRKILAIGSRAYEMIGKSSGNISIEYPIQSGVIANYKLTEALVSSILKKTLGFNRVFPFDVYVSSPASLTSVEERALLEVVYKSGASKVLINKSVMASIHDTGVPNSSLMGCMIILIGSGLTEVAVMSMGNIILSSSIKFAGESINTSIVNYLKNKYSVTIGSTSAEKIKLEIGSAMEEKYPKELEVRARELNSGNPTSLLLTSNDLLPPINESLEKVVKCIKDVLEKCPPEIVADIIDNGVLLSGGSSNLPGLSEYISNSIKIPSSIVDNPSYSVINGIGKIMES